MQFFEHFGGEADADAAFYMHIMFVGEQIRGVGDGINRGIIIF